MLSLPVDQFALYPVEGHHLGHPLPFTQDTYASLPVPNSVFFLYSRQPEDGIDPGEQHLSLYLKGKMLVFVSAFAVDETTPQRFVFQAQVSRMDIVESLYPRFAALCELESYDDLSVFAAEDHDVVRRAGSDCFIREIYPNGMFIVIQVDEGVTAQLPPAGEISEDDEDEEEDEEEDKPTPFQSNVSISDFEKFMDDRFQTFQITLTLISTSTKKVVSVPQSITGETFVNFVAPLMDPEYKIETHSIVFYLEGAKEPLEFGDDVHSAVFRHQTTQGDVHLFMGIYTVIDDSFLFDLYCLQIEVFIALFGNNVNVSFLLSSQSSIQDVMTMMDRIMGGKGKLRIVTMQDSVVGTILPPEISIGAVEVTTPLRCEVIPDDQLAMDPGDTLAAIAVMQQDYESIPHSISWIRSQFFRLVPDEPFAQTRERLLKTLGLESRQPVYYVANKDDPDKSFGQVIPEDAILRDIATASTVIKVVLSPVRENRSPIFDPIKLYN
jgi:hypothetical protein